MAKRNEWTTIDFKDYAMGLLYLSLGVSRAMVWAIYGLGAFYLLKQLMGCHG